MSLFVLVHGAFHGGWCWEQLTAELAARGHRTVTMDLPAEDASATFETYAQAVADAWVEDEEPILVGHSLGAMAIPLVASRKPVSSLVFLCPVVPNFGGMPWEDAPPMEAPGAFDGVVRSEDGTMHFPSVEAATPAFYHDCSPEVARWAFERLRPQNSTGLWGHPYPLSAWPEVPRHAIICTDDRTITLEHGTFACEERLGVAPVVLEGSHSPFLSRPAELADALSSFVSG